MTNDELKLLLVPHEQVLVGGRQLTTAERFALKVIAAWDVTSSEAPENRGGVALVLWDFRDNRIRPEGRVTFARMRPVRDDELGRPEDRIVYSGVPDVDAFAMKFLDLEKVAEAETLVERVVAGRLKDWELARARRGEARVVPPAPRTVDLLRSNEKPAAPVVHRGPAPRPRHRLPAASGNGPRPSWFDSPSPQFLEKLRELRQRP